ncbi:MAG: DMP19 family protein [Planctomycetaceae bacterium]|nr:DMP19 family protein [Planctomycetaceae bacterium]
MIRYPQPITREWVQQISDIDLPRLLWEYLLGWYDVHRSDINPWELPIGLRIVHDYTVFDGDVLNGGIVQFFENHTPREVHETLRLLRRIGAVESAEVLAKAIEVFIRKYDWPTESDERWRDRKAYGDPELQSLDKLRCNEESSARDYDLVSAYCRSHPEECIFPAL